MKRVLLPLVLWGACAGLAAADEEPRWRVAPRLRLAAGYDSNYGYAETQPVAAGAPAAEIGLRVDWTPTLRTRLSTRHAYSQEGFVPIRRGTRLDRGGGYDGALEWAYLTSLRTSVDAAAGAFVYDAPEVWGARRSRGAYAAIGAQWSPGRALLRAYGDGWVASDAVTAAALRDDNSISAGLELRWAPRPWFSLGVWGEGQHGESSAREFRYDGGAAGASLRVGLWRGAALHGWGALRRRDYLTARRDTRATAGGALRQALGDANRLALQAELTKNQSNVFAYERQTAALVWECEPAWLF